MIRVFAHIVQVIVLAPGADTLLAVDNSLQATHVTVRVNHTLEDGLELKTTSMLGVFDCVFRSLL